MSFKSEAIEYTERVSNQAAVVKYKVDVKNRIDQIAEVKWH